MNIKQEFMRAVQILAPNDQFIINAANLVREEVLPKYPGGVALEFVAAVQRLRASSTYKAIINSSPSKRSIKRRRLKHGIRTAPPRPHQPAPLTLKYAVRVKSAEYWLKLGQPAQAIIELERLPEDAKKHPWAVRTMASAIGAAQEMIQTTFQE
jgi:hypothetical protein